MLFTDEQVESAYRAQLDKQTTQRLRFATTLLLSFMAFIHIWEFVHLSEISFQVYASSWGLVGFIRVSFVLITLLLRIAPARYENVPVGMLNSVVNVEVAVCAAQIYTLCAICALNAFRLERHSLIDEVPESAYTKVWEHCEDDLVIHARDAILLIWILFSQFIFSVLVPIRVMLSWIPGACVSILFSSFLIFPSLRQGRF